MKTVYPNETLVYHDGIAVFAGCDSIGGNYIGVIIDTIGHLDRYIVTGVSPARLRQFRSGMVDLRSLLLEAPDGEWFITQADRSPGEPLVLEPQEGSLSDTVFLPEEGFTMEDLPVDEAVLRQAKENGKLVFECRADPPETVGGHRIRAETLGQLLIHLQTIVKHAYRAALRDIAPNTRQQIDTTDGYLMDVIVPAAAGSYRVIFEASRPPDMFGSGELIRALQRLDEVFATASEPDAAPQLLQPHKGHLAGAYIRLMQFLADHETGLRYGWADPTFSVVRHGGISETVARQLAESLSAVRNLATETVELVGRFVRVNVEAGNWGLETDNGTRVGKVAGDGPNLDGLIVGRRYRFSCVEDIEIDAVGRETHTLYLHRITQA